ncbi:Wzz/FepE/Etk N-terminal domain-containing protein [Streptosporangium lutulentum]
MGDSGSLFIGFTLACSAVVLVMGQAPNAAVAGLLLPTFVATFDTCAVFLSRTLAGRSPLRGGTDHVSHRLRRIGLGTRTVAAALGAIAAITGTLCLTMALGWISVLTAAVVAGAITVVLISLLRGVSVYSLPIVPRLLRKSVKGGVDPVDLLHYVRLARRNWLLILLSLILAVGAAIAVTSSTPPKYVATITMMVSGHDREGSLSTAIQAGALSQQRVQSYANLLPSHRVVSQIAKDDDIQRVQENITAQVVPGTVILRATVTDTDPVRAARLANDLGTAFTRLIDEIERPALTHRKSVPATRTTVRAIRTTSPMSRSRWWTGRMFRRNRSVHDHWSTWRSPCWSHCSPPWP